MNLIKEIRSFFDGQGFWEVQTPVLQASPGMEVHVQAFKTELLDPYQSERQARYLHTSPEFAMKKLLVAGAQKIYQICPVFRNAEGSALHAPEFTMIEWYRAHASYEAIMDDCEGLLRAVAKACGIEVYRRGDMVCDPFADWERISVAEAFEKYTDIRLSEISAEALKKLGLHVAEDDSWEDLFMRVMGQIIEPQLGQGQPTILYDYPIELAALARPKPENSAFAERFELYVCGVELANAFGELTDPAEQRQRFEAAMAEKQRLYGHAWPVEEDFLAALEHGMPQSGGIALGIDRLTMLACGAERIEDVLWL